MSVPVRRPTAGPAGRVGPRGGFSMTDGRVQAVRRAFYMLPEGRTVQVLERTARTLVVHDPVTGEQWTIRREPFERRLTDGEIQRVQIRWEPFGEAVTV